MTKNTGTKNIPARGKKVFVGVDFHKRTWHVTAISHGAVLFKGAIPACYDALERILERFHDCRIQVAYEAGPCGFGLYDVLDNHDIRCIVTPPSLIPVETGNKVKTDKKDNLKLATLLEAGMLKAVFVLSEKTRMDRDLLRTRRQLVENRAGIMQQIKGKLLFHSLRVKEKNRRGFSARHIRRVLDHEFPEESLRKAIAALLDTYRQLSSTIRTLNKEIRALSKTDEYKSGLHLLMTVPGIGLLTAMEILTELGSLRA